MPESFARVALLGLGLMGGSLGLALRAGGLARHTVGYDAVPAPAERARARGAVDEICASPMEAARGADLVVLAAPVLAERELFAAIAPVLAPGVLITDLGSTKQIVVSWADELLPDTVEFIGGHPMAGSEQSGVDAATPDLYRGVIWCLTPTQRTGPGATHRISTLIRALGAVPLPLDAETHDRLAAGASHLPLVAAVTLMRTLAESADWQGVARLAAGGLRDTTRIASGNPVMARDIVLTNGPAVAVWLDSYIAELQRLRDQIVAGDSAVEDSFVSARAAREAWLRQAGPKKC